MHSYIKVASNTCKDQWRKCAKEEWYDTDAEDADGEKKLPDEMIYLETDMQGRKGRLIF